MDSSHFYIQYSFELVWNFLQDTFSKKHGVKLRFIGAFVRAVTRNPLLIWTSREIVGWTPFLIILILLFQLDLNSFS